MRVFLLTVALALGCSSSTTAQLDDILKRAEDALAQRDTSGLSDDKIIAGLRQALQLSTSKAVALTGRPDGFLKNEAIKILLPPKLQTVGKGLRLLGMGSRVDELEIGMNRAAEQATPQAKQIFLVALRKMSFDDARQVLTGGDTAATDYFKRTSSSDLTAAFSPIVHRSMERVGVVQQYDQVLNSAPGGTLLAANLISTNTWSAKRLTAFFTCSGNRKNKSARTLPRRRRRFLKKYSAGNEAG